MSAFPDGDVLGHLDREMHLCVRFEIWCGSLDLNNGVLYILRINCCLTVSPIVFFQQVSTISGRPAVDRWPTSGRLAVDQRSTKSTGGRTAVGWRSISRIDPGPTTNQRTLKKFVVFDCF